MTLIKMINDGFAETEMSKRNKGYETCYFHRIGDGYRQYSLVDPKFMKNCPEDHYVAHVSAFRDRIRTKTGRVLKKRTDRLYIEKFLYVPIEDTFHEGFKNGLTEKLEGYLIGDVYEHISDSDKKLGVYQLTYRDIQWFREIRQWKNSISYEFDIFPKHRRDELNASLKQTGSKV